MKTNKSYLKRLKITRNGKILARKPGKNHFNAKASRRSQLNKNRSGEFVISNKNKSRYLINA
jgi:ribosomal protein L35